VIYREYGKTGIKVSAIGFGGMRFEDQQDTQACASLVKAAYDADINYFDTAPGYGKSEELFGAAFKEMKKTRAKKPFYVSTKTFAAEPDMVRKELETSLERMGLDYIDFYHVWCIMSLDAYHQRKTAGVLKEFEKLKDQGLIKNICVSTHMTGADIGTMLSDYPFDGILLGYSVMNFTYRQAGLDAAALNNMGLVIMNPLGGGIIPRHPEKFDFVKTQQDETVVDAALRFLIDDSRISVALVGLSSEKQLAEAINAVDGYKPISADNRQKIYQGLQSSFNELCTSCGYCDNCPQEIPVLKMMDIYNQHVLADRMEMINRIRWYWGIELENELNAIIDKCTRCGQCEQACTQKLPICERMDFIKAKAAEFVKEQQKKQE